jgi:hypothetical protein
MIKNKKGEKIILFQHNYCIYMEYFDMILREMMRYKMDDFLLIIFFYVIDKIKK